MPHKLHISWGETSKESEAKLEDLDYGTVLTGYFTHPSSIYMKVNKKAGDSLRVEITEPKEGCILLNLKTGNLRSAERCETVRVLDAEMTVELADDARDYYKC